MKMPTVHFRRMGTDVTCCGRAAWELVTWFERRKVTCKTCKRVSRKARTVKK